MLIDTSPRAGYHASLHHQALKRLIESSDQLSAFYYSRFTIYDSLIYGFRNYSHTQRSGTRPGNRLSHSSDLSNFNLRAGGPWQKQGLRIRAHTEPNPQCVGTKHSGARRRAL